MEIANRKVTREASGNAIMVGLLATTLVAYVIIFDADLALTRQTTLVCCPFSSFPRIFSKEEKTKKTTLLFLVQFDLMKPKRKERTATLSTSGF